MKKPKQILDKRLQAFYIIFDEKIPDKSIAFIIGAMQEYAEEYHQSELLKLNIPAVIGSPIQLEPVLAEIEHINDLGKSKWYEVVYFDENWRSYAGSKTFEDGEKVIKWKYVKDCL